MPGKDSKYIEFTKWTNRGRGTMGEFKFKDTVENLKTNLLDNLGLWVPTAIAANGIINGIIAYILFITRGGYTKQIQLVSHYSRMLPSAGCEEVGLTSFGYNDVFKMEVANGFFYENGATITLK